MTVIWDKNPDLHKLKTGKEKKMILKKPNPKASLMSILFQTEERHILMMWDKFLQENNRCLSVYIHDGGYVKKLEGETVFPQALLDLGSEYIKQHLNYDVKLVQKTLDHNWTPYNTDDFVLEHPFETVAKEFEDNHLKIVNKSYFIKETPEGNIIMNETKIRSSHAHMFYNEECTGKDGNIAVVKKPFIVKWLSHEHDIRRKEDVGIYPNAALCPTNIFNLWTPFAMETKTNDFIEHKEGLDFILNHLRILCGNQDDVYDYFVKWNAQMIQYPEIKTIMPTFISDQGAGKGTYLDLMQKILGETKLFETTAPSRDVWGNFNSKMMNSFFVVLNELSKKETMESEGKIKGLITDNNLTINPKGLDQFQIKSYHRFLTATNNVEPVTTCNGDRRNLIIRCSDEKKGDTAYFDKFHEYLNDDNVLRTFYKYLKDIPDMDKFHKIPIPETEYQNLLKEKNVPIHLQWLESFVRENSENDPMDDETDGDIDTEEEQSEQTISLLGSDIYKMFKKWTDDNGIEYNTSSIKLGMLFKISKIDGIEKGQHTRKGELTTFNITKLKNHFQIGCIIDL